MSSETEEIKDRLSVVELIGEYLRLTKAGSNWKALCPFHNEKTPSFMVSDERRSWHCFGCAKGGDIFSFMMEMEGIGFREALEMLARKAGVELKRSRNYEAGIRNEKGKDQLYKILELAAKWYEKNLWEGKGKEKILKYLHERGLKDETIRKFRLGYAPEGWRNILEFLTKRGYKVDEIARTGLLVEKNPKSLPHRQAGEILNPKQIQNFNPPAGGQNSGHYDRFRDRIMFPIQDVMGRVVGFSARIAPGGDEKSAKYINTPQTELYDKSKALYGIHLAKTNIKQKDNVILVEGNIDVITLHQAGFSNAIAVSGTALAQEQIKTIKRYTENAAMAFDMDSAGQAAAKRSAKICLMNDLNVKMILLHAGKDAADVLKEDKKVWENAMRDARGVVDYYLEDAFACHDAGDPAGKKKIASVLLNIIKDIASPIEKAHWVEVLARKLAVESKVLFEVLQKIKPEGKSEKKEKEQALPRETLENFLEKRILGILILYPRETHAKIQSLSARGLAFDGKKELLEKILKSGGLGAAEMIGLFSDYETRKLLEGAVFEIEVEAKDSAASSFDPAAELEKAVSRLRQKKLREKIAGIALDIKEAEQSGDKEAVSVLMKEFQKLSGQLSV